MRLPNILIAGLLIVIVCAGVAAQDPNPVERQVANPLTDTPNINPVSAEQSIKAPKQKRSPDSDALDDGQVVVYSDKQSSEGPDGKRIITYSGNVDARYGKYRMQADRVVIYEENDLMVADGSVVFDEGDDQRITGAKGTFNLNTKLGNFEDSTGFTNQTNDGTVLYFTADKVERTQEDEIVVTKGKFTSCDEAVPKWSFTADEAVIRINDRVKLKNAKFRVKDIPLVPLPYASIPIKERDRASGFLTPTFGFSGNKGVRIQAAYFQTLGRSADITFRGDIYSSRGIGYGFDVRTRTNDRSFFNFGLYGVRDRIFGHKRDAEHPDQGGSLFYAEGVQYFSNGWTAAADVRVTSNLAFRQVFSDGVQQIISPIEVSQGFANKSWGNYTLDLLARTQVISIPNVTISTRNLPSLHFEKRPSKLSFFDPAYFSFRTSVEGVSRREKVNDIGLYASQTGSTEPIRTALFGLRYDAYPEVTIPIRTKYVNFTLNAAMRLTYYSNSFNDMRRVVERNLLRKYGELEFDIRPVPLAKNYYGKNDEFRFRHVIEPYVTYRFRRGIDNFNEIIRFDQLDTITDTNEIEFGVANRIFTRRYTEAVTPEARRQLNAVRAASAARSVAEGRADSGDSAISEDDRHLPVSPDRIAFEREGLGGDRSRSTESLSIQPYEIFRLVIRGKYFFDKNFGGALIPGRRNQIASMTDLSFYTFGGVARRFSPLSIDLTYRPQRTIFFNTRMDVGVQGDALRAVSATVGYEKPLLKIFQTFYYTRAVDMIPSLANQLPQPAAVAMVKEPGTLRGSQWSPSIFLGNRDKGWYGGASVFFDFENRRAARLSPMISSLYTLGYAYDCCALAVQFYKLNVGQRNENRLLFSFRLKGIGAFGTEQFGQGLR